MVRNVNLTNYAEEQINPQTNTDKVSYTKDSTTITLTQKLEKMPYLDDTGKIPSSMIPPTQGQLIYLGQIELNTKDVTQEALTARAKELGYTTLRPGYVLVDLESNDWWYGAGDNEDQWVNIGFTSIEIASNTSLGIVKGSTNDLKVQVDAEGVMSVTNLSTKLNAINTSLDSKLEESNIIQGDNIILSKEGNNITITADVNGAGILKYGEGIEAVANETVVTYSNIIYMCSVAHTTTATFDHTKWTNITAILRPWSQLTQYYENQDFVEYQQNIFKCKNSHISSTTFDNSNWTLLCGYSISKQAITIQTVQPYVTSESTIYEDSALQVFKNGLLVNPSNYTIGSDRKTIDFGSDLSVGDVVILQLNNPSTFIPELSYTTVTYQVIEDNTTNIPLGLSKPIEISDILGVVVKTATSTSPLVSTEYTTNGTDLVLNNAVSANDIVEVRVMSGGSYTPAPLSSTNYRQSPWQNIPDSGAYTYVHNLGRKPDYAKVIYRCKVADNTYSEGDLVFTVWNENNNPVDVFYSSNSLCRVDFETNSLNTSTKDGTNIQSLIRNNWEFKVVLMYYGDVETPSSIPEIPGSVKSYFESDWFDIASSGKYDFDVSDIKSLINIDPEQRCIKLWAKVKTASGEWQVGDILSLDTTNYTGLTSDSEMGSVSYWRNNVLSVSLGSDSYLLANSPSGGTATTKLLKSDVQLKVIVSPTSSIGEAPEDGYFYVRSDGEWVRKPDLSAVKTKIYYTFESAGNTIPLGTTLTSKDQIDLVIVGNVPIMPYYYDLNEEKTAIILTGEQLPAGTKAVVSLYVDSNIVIPTGIQDAPVNDSPYIRENNNWVSTLNTKNMIGKGIVECPDNVFMTVDNAGMFTLQKGSVIYLSDGNGSFERITIESNLTKVSGIDSFPFYHDSYLDSMQAAYIFSSTTQPTEYANNLYAVWYNPTTKVCQYTQTGGTSWKPCSLPIGYYDSVGNLTVFNGYSYIGDSFFILPGMVVLFANGFDSTTGEYSNIRVKVENVVVGGYASDYQDLGVYLNLDSNGDITANVRPYIESIEYPTISIGSTWYNPSTNLYYRNTVGELDYTETTLVKIGSYSRVNSKIENFALDNCLGLVDKTSLDNILSNYISTSTITNCITEIPQDIKLELNSNYSITLKAGSKIYIPNGFESDGVTKKFDVVIIKSDITNTRTGDETQEFLFGTNNSINFWKNLYSGDTAPSEQQNMVWYDTANNIIKYTTDTGSTWINSGFSLPLCIYTRFESGIKSIDQVFNGFGYIGSTIFVLPGVEGLSPNGIDYSTGIKKNNILSIKNILTYTCPDITANVILDLYVNKMAINSQAFDKPTADLIFFDEINNYNYAGLEISNDIWVGSTRIENGKIVLFNPKHPISLVDKNDSSWIARQAMPSKKAIPLTLGASGSIYIAPANGYFSIDGQGPNWVDLAIVYPGLNYGYCFASRSSDKYCRVVVPVSTGSQCQILFDTDFTNLISFNFIYAEGEV